MIYLTALAYKGKGDAAKAKELAALGGERERAAARVLRVHPRQGEEAGGLDGDGVLLGGKQEKACPRACLLRFGWCGALLDS